MNRATAGIHVGQLNTTWYWRGVHVLMWKLDQKRQNFFSIFWERHVLWHAMMKMINSQTASVFVCEFWSSSKIFAPNSRQILARMRVFKQYWTINYLMWRPDLRNFLQFLCVKVFVSNNSHPPSRGGWGSTLWCESLPYLLACGEELCFCSFCCWCCCMFLSWLEICEPMMSPFILSIPRLPAALSDLYLSAIW